MPHFISFALNTLSDVIVLRFISCSVSFAFIGCHSFLSHAWPTCITNCITNPLSHPCDSHGHSHYLSSIYTQVDSACISLDLISQDSVTTTCCVLLCRNPIDPLSPVFSSFALNQSLVPSLRLEVAAQLQVCVTLCSVLPVTSMVTSGLTSPRRRGWS